MHVAVQDLSGTDVRSLALRITTIALLTTKLVKASPLHHVLISTSSTPNPHNPTEKTVNRKPTRASTLNPKPHARHHSKAEAKALAHGTQEKTEDKADECRESRAHLTGLNTV